MFDFIGDLFDGVGDFVGGLFGGGGASGAGRTPVSGLPWLTGGDSSADFFDLAGGILGSGSVGGAGSFWGSPMAGHMVAAIGSELLREDPYDIALDRERARRDAMDFGFTPASRGNGLAPTEATYNREGGAKPASADWWQETEEERRRKQERLMGHAA